MLRSVACLKGPSSNFKSDKENAIDFFNFLIRLLFTSQEWYKKEQRDEVFHSIGRQYISNLRLNVLWFLVQLI